MAGQKIRITRTSGSRGRAKTIELQSMWGMKLLGIVCQFDRSYCKLKDLWGESGGIPAEEAMAIRDDAMDAMREFSKFMERFSENVGFAYYPPKGLRTRVVNPNDMNKKPERCAWNFKEE